MTPSKVLAAPLIALVGIYRYLISPLLGPRCRYQPTCSAYAVEALQRHGPVRGSVLALRRILRCHPWGGHGWDPVPPEDQAKRGRTRPHVNSERVQ